MDRFGVFSGVLMAKFMIWGLYIYLLYIYRIYTCTCIYIYLFIYLFIISICGDLRVNAKSVPGV